MIALNIDTVTSRSPGPDQGPGLNVSAKPPAHPPIAGRKHRPLFMRLLGEDGVARVEQLLQRPCWPAAGDEKLQGLGLARVVLGKAVATSTARQCFFLPRFGVVPIACLEVEHMRQAVKIVRESIVAKLDDGIRAQLAEGGDEVFFEFRAVPKRVWRECDQSPLIVQIVRLDDVLGRMPTAGVQSRPLPFTLNHQGGSAWKPMD